MLVSLSWLKKYVEIPTDAAALAEDLTMLGLNVERVIQRGVSDTNIVVGSVLETSRHPNADKLTLCRVDVADGEPRSIICGAPNVAAGQQVLVALPGAKLPNGLKIRAAKIRGEHSEGMICSAKELGIGEDAGGIMVLEGDYNLGLPIQEVIPSDEILEIEVTPNRPDQLSHIGVAREIAALYKLPLNTPKILNSDNDQSGAKPDFKVKIENGDDCPRYVGLRVSGAKVAPSPAWLTSALEAVGVNSVNNIVDITNYVLMETGQPLHAFDFHRIGGSKVVIRRGKKKEKLVALDGKEYELNKDYLVIANDDDAVAVAGIIGGEPSAVQLDTTEILIESANFFPRLVRKGARALGLSTDASYRFERGADREQCLKAARRAAEMIVEIAGGEIGGWVDSYPNPHAPQTLEIRRAQTKRILGAVLSTDEIEALLKRLGFNAVSRSVESVVVDVPSNRPDVVAEIDLIEEVGRLYGYERIGVGWNFRTTTFAKVNPYERFTESLSEHLTARGYTEVITTNFTDGRELEDFGWDDKDPRSHPIPIRNPLNHHHRYLKTSLLPGMLDVLRHNIDHGNRRVRIYQIGKAFLSLDRTEKLPTEQRLLTLVISAQDHIDFWNNSNKAPELFDIKQELEILLGLCKVDGSSDVWYDFDKAAGQFRYVRKDDVIVDGGIVPDKVALRYDFEQPVWTATIDLEKLYGVRVLGPKLRPVPEYPVSRRDLSLVAKAGTDYQDIEKSLVKHSGPLLESLHVFDVYSGDQLEDRATAYGVRLTFRSPERTLTDIEIDQVIDKLLAKLKNELDIEIRS